MNQTRRLLSTGSVTLGLALGIALPAAALPHYAGGLSVSASIPRNSDPDTHTHTNSGLVNLVWAF